MKQILSSEFIVYVHNQEVSSRFYETIFRTKPSLEVPGMTEFTLSGNLKIGLMPNAGIAKILTDKTPHPEKGNGIPRCELYFHIEDIQFEFENAVKAGAKIISEIKDRDWGDRVCYFSDPDGHIIAFAEKIK
ncbi:lactoylglutathione lyase-like lyase [Flavobacterium limnosediminis JC2902]|uniref:Lactoylglutathione lyase-like lyase n=1 Tax=Flavobacterium limnosediminis JC2902 TaxID=1341181 RepID=V6SPA5_9FLAO|nr:VOC family protein [Flavobacterium limnosediminis]ESU28456.1 lactoylglutathione lyase-like lyase [Flavobacterium limnosediminis JC2902]